MGLDMYAYRIKGKLSSEKKPCINPQPEEFFYWRKNRHLNNVMKNIFIRKYGRNEEFNCRLLNLDSNDLDYIENLIRSDRIEEYDAPGLFFGDNDYEEELIEYLTEIFSDNMPTLTELNDYISYEWEQIYKAIGFKECKDNE